MRRSEYETLLKQQDQNIAELEAALLVLRMLHEDAKKMLEAQDAINSRLMYSMDVFDPASSARCLGDDEVN